MKIIEFCFHAMNHIKRIFTIPNGVKRNLPQDSSIYVEEKIDGFNIRLLALGGKILGFSRGGFLDRFVTEKVSELKLEKFFADHPDKILCGEMIGNTPYTEPAKDFDVRLFVFDIDDGSGNYLPCQERYAILKRYGIDGVPFLGRFEATDLQGLKKVALALNKGKREGMVLKTADRKSAVKYVTPEADIEDIAHESALFFDMPLGFYYQRILRSAISIKDFEFDRKEYSRRLGNAFYEGLELALKNAEKGEPIEKEFEIRIRDLTVWDSIKKHMSREVKIDELWRREENGKTKIRFRKIYKKTTKILTSYLAGKAITD